MMKKYSLRPRIREWRDMLAQTYNIKEMLFFADFSNIGIRSEIMRIREVTNLVIETQNTSPHYKKDFTDFIMLDYIYQKALSSPDVDTFIIFTGDGHFSSVVRFLVQSCGKKVLVYAVKDGLSGLLRSVCSKSFEIPTDDEIDVTYYSMIAKQIKETDTTGKRLPEPSFSSVINAVSEYYGIDRETIKDEANKMSLKGYITVTSHKISYNKRISTVRINESKLASDGVKLITDPVYLMMPARQERKEKTQQQEINRK
ncbi:MAG: NYN domain-containing protein [Clostridia bacterium]|nr:NYN domain-containing protein [Clostridia bacterium]